MSTTDSQMVMAQLIAGAADEGRWPTVMLKSGGQAILTAARLDEENLPGILHCRVESGMEMFLHLSEISGFTCVASNLEV